MRPIIFINYTYVLIMGVQLVLVYQRSSGRWVVASLPEFAGWKSDCSGQQNAADLQPSLTPPVPRHTKVILVLKQAE